MGKVVVETRIAVDVGRCFDLARDVEMHCRTAAHTEERAVAGRTEGLLELGDEVTFEGVHFGIRWRLAARIVELERPSRFVDEMVEGPFRSLRHVHEFQPDGSRTLMIDTLEWKSPFGPLGRLADRLFLEGYMREFLRRRNRELQRNAEVSAV